MKVGNHIPVTASFSITQKIELVRIIEVLIPGEQYKVQYSNGYVEELPIGAFIV
jgi:hypothetical protein